MQSTTGTLFIYYSCPQNVQFKEPHQLLVALKQPGTTAPPPVAFPSIPPVSGMSQVPMQMLTTLLLLLEWLIFLIPQILIVQCHHLPYTPGISPEGSPARKGTREGNLAMLNTLSLTEKLLTAMWNTFANGRDSTTTWEL